MTARRSIEAADRVRAAGLVLPLAAWTAAFFLLPLAVMALTSLRPGGLAAYAAMWNSPEYLGAFLNSLEIAATVTLLSVALAYPLAWIVAEMVPARWQRLALALAVVPFWTSYVVRSYAWSLVLARQGVLNGWLEGLGLPALALSNSRAAVVIGFTHFFTMLLALTIYASLVRLPPNLKRAAADLGAGPVATFRHVVWPLALPGVATGAFLTFALCIGDYVTPQILGGGRDLALPQLIMLQLGRRGDIAAASALSLVLMAAVTIAYLCSARFMRGPR
ncbi:MAG: ABC transporter permease [Paracoccaceae bacterium]|nr:MAG: ABC transporter permease [Paracoccaceae bacterium]